MLNQRPKTIEEAVFQEGLPGRELMIDTSRKFRHEVKRVFTESLRRCGIDAESGYAVLAFGSPRRSEMLPNSDGDCILITPDSDSILRPIFVDALSKLPYDKIDVPSQWTSLEDLSKNASIGSPESDYADVLFISGDPNIRDTFDRGTITEPFFSEDLLLSKLLFQHYFFDFRYDTKFKGNGTNLKYSRGGARDFIYFDWFFDYSQGRLARQNIVSGTPQCYDALDYINNRGLITLKDYHGQRVSMDFIVMVKHLVLEMNKDTTQKGKGYMNVETAERLLQFAPDYFRTLGMLTPLEVVLHFDQSRANIYSLRERVFVHLLGKIGINRQSDLVSVVSYAISERSIPHLIFGIWECGRVYDQGVFTQLFNEFHESDCWMVLASFASSLLISPEQLDTLVRLHAHRSGYEYLIRVAVRNTHVQKQTLGYLLSLPRLALDDDVNDRYREEIVTKLM